MHTTFVSSYVPRKCGIATYTRDLVVELQKQKQKVAVVAMENPAIPSEYDAPVVASIQQNELTDYAEIAAFINKSSTDCVHLQHEFGLFGGRDGQDILEFAVRLSKPLVTTFHTVLLTPSAHQTHITQVLARLSRRVIVMDEIAKDRLVHVYGLSAKDIFVILHGAPIIRMKQDDAKKTIKSSDSFILLANNLLSRNKGMEYAIEAVGKAHKHIPNLVFFIVGETHPLVKISEGESYREELMQLVQTLHLEHQVIMKNEYVSLKELKVYLAASDVYITPYLDPQQITSGTLSYAIGADKACIATEYIYAKELLAGGRGMLVPFRNSDAIAEAIIDLYKNPRKRHDMEKKAGAFRKDMSWRTVAQRHTLLYKDILKQERDISAVTQRFIRNPLDVSYLLSLTDTVGVMQHAYHTIPNRKFGYSTDDNARALIVLSRLFQEKKSKPLFGAIKTYVSFLQFAQDTDGQFHTFLNFHHTWDDAANVTDAYGRAMWAIGLFLSTNTDSYFSEPMNTLFTAGLDHIDKIHDLRNAAYTILGLYYYVLRFDSRTDTALKAFDCIKKLADFLNDRYMKTKVADWDWFEEQVTYDNFRIPQALFAAYMITGNERYKVTAIATLAFITDCNFNEKLQHFDFIGQNGWYTKGGKKEEFDQQPLEAAGAVDAHVFAAKAQKKKHCPEKALLAFEWFFGKNRNHRSVYDRETKGVHDGLNLRGVNQNEGAESMVCFLMASLSMKEYSKKIQH